MQDTCPFRGPRGPKPAPGELFRLLPPNPASGGPFGANPFSAQVSGCLGARLTGGGFGGCTINLVETSRVEAFASQLIEKYHQQFGLNVEVLTCKPAGGAQVINLS